MFGALLRTFQRGLMPIDGRFLPPVSALCSSSDLPAHTNLSDFQKSKLTSLFKRYLDLDDNNVIEWDDFRRSLINYKVMYKYPDEHPVYKRLVRQKRIAWSSMLRQMDDNMDGRLTIDEFFDSIARAIDGRASLWDSPSWLRDWVNHGCTVVLYWSRDTH